LNENNEGIFGIEGEVIGASPTFINTGTLETAENKAQARIEVNRDFAVMNTLLTSKGAQIVWLVGTIAVAWAIRLAISELAATLWLVGIGVVVVVIARRHASTRRRLTAEGSDDGTTYRRLPQPRRLRINAPRRSGTRNVAVVADLSRVRIATGHGSVRQQNTVRRIMKRSLRHITARLP
jgi:hypothetical protein